MSWEVHVSEQAENDLRAIFSYIAFELTSVKNASDQLDRLEAGISALDRFPFRYHRYEIAPWDRRGTRYFSIDNFCVFYIPMEEKGTVEIVRVLYAGRDMDRVMAEEASANPEA
jgi:toxin ParE1/3/4